MTGYRFTWAQVCSEEAFRQLRSDPRFISATRLARVINSLRFCQGAAIATVDNTRPEGRRQRSSSFLFICAVLYEGFKVLRESGSTLREYESFQRMIVPLMRNKEVRGFIDSIVKATRNQASFHFDLAVIADYTPHISLPEYRFVSGFGDRSGDTWYELADEVVVHSLVAHWKRPGDHASKLTKFIAAVSEIQELFVHACDSLIVEVLDDMGWLTLEN